APRHEKFAGLVELDDSGVGLGTVTVGNEDVAVWRDQHVRRLVERVGTVARYARLAKRHQYFALGAELVDNLSLSVGRIDAVIAYPHVTVLVDGNAVREIEHTGTEAAEELAGCVEVEDRRDRRGHTAIRPTAVVRPDGSVRRDIDAGRGSPLASVRKLSEA